MAEREATGGMDRQVLARRTKDFALRAMTLVDALPPTPAGRAIAHQLVRSATSVGANYRAAQRGRSKAELIAKLGICIEEIDECAYWLELIIEGGLLPEQRIGPLHREADELTAIFVTAARSAKANTGRP